MAKKKNDLELKQEARQVEKTLAEHCAKDGHHFPQTRREFLNSGVLAAATHLAAPSLISLVSRSAWSAEELSCNLVDASMPTYINLQLAGGPAMFAQAIPFKPNDTHMGGTNYRLMGLGDGEFERYFANAVPFLAPQPRETGSGMSPGSGFIQGLKNVMTAAEFSEIVGQAASKTDTSVTSKTSFVGVACKSVSDVLTNKHDLSGMLLNAGVGGSALPYILCESGQEDTRSDNVQTGIQRFKGAIYDTPTYLPASTAESINTALGFKGALASQLKPGGTLLENLAVQEKIIELISDLSAHQATVMLKAPNSSEGRKTFYHLLQCASKANLNNLKNQKGFNADVYTLTGTQPGENDLKNIWAKNYTNGTAKETDSFTGSFKNRVTGELGVTISTALRGFSGSCTAILGGYDYHTNVGKNRNGQQNHDVFFGETVGRILLTAHKLQKPMFLYVSADGSVKNPTSPTTSTAWDGDYDERGMNYIIAYHPTKTLESRGYKKGSHEDSRYQLNHFVNGKGKQGLFEDIVVSTDHPIANTDAQELAAAAVFVNYLAFAGRQDVLNKSELLFAKNKLRDAALSKGEPDIFKYYGRIFLGS